jgi:hypothetical protein
MLRPSLTTAAIVLLGASVMAQSEIKSRLQPVTSPIQRAGVFHVSTGTWTRNTSLANVTGPDTIYNNSCSLVYFGAQITGEKWQHRGRIPSPTGPTTDSQFYPGNNATHEFDERPGCNTQYTVNGFEILYCSSKPSGAGLMTQVHQFASSYTNCPTGDMVPNVTITITGLPGGTATGAQICWVVGLDLDAASASFNLLADGDGTYNNGTSDQNTFGWSFGPTSAVAATDQTGPIIAGNFTWTGGALSGPLTPCTGTDGTIWDSPVDLTEPGTGMSSQNFFRITGTNTATGGSGCYFFGGTPHADFYLKMFSNANCAPVDPVTDFCFPGVGGVITCPCGNPPVAPGKGCNNFGAGPVASAELSGAGTPSIASDTVVLTATGENNTSTTIFLQSPSSSSTGLIFGGGVRCITGSLKRLYTGPASAGTISRPLPADPRIHVRSAALGDPLAPGAVRFYMSYYRDPGASGPCSNAASTFNCSNSGKMTWAP